MTKLLGLGPSAETGAPKQECQKFMSPLLIRHGIFDALVVEHPRIKKLSSKGTNTVPYRF